MSMNTRIIQHENYGECLFADNGLLEIGIPLTFGIRIGHLSFVGEKNVFYEQPKDVITEGWNVYGGHRLWIAPECEADYVPDDAPIKFVIGDDSVEVVQKATAPLRVEKRIILRLDGDRVHVTHKIRNRGFKPITCALWGVSSLAGGGIEHIDLHRREGGLNPLYRLSVWDHTSLGDPRVAFERDRITVTHLPIDGKVKIGIGHPIPSVRYTVGGCVFTKQYEVVEGGKYPDGGVSYETYTDSSMVEMESLSPLKTLLPLCSAEHREIWSLCRE